MTQIVAISKSLHYQPSVHLEHESVELSHFVCPPAT